MKENGFEFGFEQSDPPKGLYERVLKAREQIKLEYNARQEQIKKLNIKDKAQEMLISNLFLSYKRLPQNLRLKFRQLVIEDI